MSADDPCPNCGREFCMVWDVGSDDFHHVEDCHEETLERHVASQAQVIASLHNRLTMTEAERDRLRQRVDNQRCWMESSLYRDKERDELRSEVERLSRELSIMTSDRDKWAELFHETCVAATKLRDGLLSAIKLGEEGWSSADDFTRRLERARNILEEC